MSAPGVIPPWPTRAPSHSAVVLREFVDADAAVGRELSTDPYVPLVSTLPSLRTAERAGYQREGPLRGYMEIGGRRRDLSVWAALRP